MPDSDLRHERLATLAALRVTAGELMSRADQEWMRQEIVSAAIEIASTVDSLARTDVDWSRPVFLTAADDRIKGAAKRLDRVREALAKSGFEAPPRREGDK